MGTAKYGWEVSDKDVTSKCDVKARGNKVAPYDLTRAICTLVGGCPC